MGRAAQTVGPRRNCRDHVRWNPHANSAMRRARRCLGWRVDPQRAAGSSCQLLLRCVCAPVGRDEPGAARGLHAAPFPGACARASAPGRRVVLRRRDPRININALAPSLGTGDTSAMAAAKRKPAAKKPAAKKAAAKKPAVKKPARARVDLHCSSSRHPSFSTHRPRKSRRRRSAERRPDAISMLFP